MLGLNNSTQANSFRDPSGFIFVRAGEMFRQVNEVYREHYDLLMDSGLYQELANCGLLVKHEVVEADLSGCPGAYKVLRPERVPFISYPYEWSFSQLKDAALTTLEVQKKALEHGMTLKDASAYNIQFLMGKPIFIDLLSFERLQEGTPWIGYRQFCQHFLAPLALMSYRNIDLGQLSRIYIDGIPLDLASSLLPMRTIIYPSIQMHIHLHARFQGKASDRSRAKHGRQRSFSLMAFKGLIDSLESMINKLKWEPRGTEWADYENEDSYTGTALTHKTEVVARFIREVQPGTTWDLGGNTGRFSRLAADAGAMTVSFDKDPAAVEKNYLTAQNRQETNLLPLLLDLTNPSPTIGWANGERMSISERGPTDLLLALALIHHLAIGNNVPLGMISDFFGRLCHWAIIEFVPKNDKKVVHLLSTREDIFPAYTQDQFELEFSNVFEMREKCRIEDSERTLYLLKRK